MPTTKDDSRVLEFWGGPRDGERTTLADFLERYPKKIASFPIQGSALLHVYKADIEEGRGVVRYLGEMPADSAEELASDKESG
jgi:hypothetical protein